METFIKINANISCVDDIAAVLKNNADGIGLFRSEFLYFESSDFPTEDAQFAAYKKVLESMAEKKSLYALWTLVPISKSIILTLIKRKIPLLAIVA